MFSLVESRGYQDVSFAPVTSRGAQEEAARDGLAW